MSGCRVRLPCPFVAIPSHQEPRNVPHRWLPTCPTPKHTQAHSHPMHTPKCPSLYIKPQSDHNVEKPQRQHDNIHD